MLGGFLRRNFPKPDYSFRAHPSTPKGMITEHLKQLRHAHEDRLEGIWRIGKLARHQDAVNVLTVSCETANLAINGHENFKKTGIPFYLGIGEHHHKPLHHIHNMAASENIRKEGIPHTKSHELDLSYLLDQLQSRVADKLDRPITEDEASYIRKKAEGSSIYMKLHTLDTEVDSRYNYAPYTGIRTRSAHLSRLIDSGITVKLTDAPIIPESREEDKCYIQTDKPDIQAILTDASFLTQWKPHIDALPTQKGSHIIKSTSELGIAIRNEYSIINIMPENGKPKSNVIHFGGEKHVINPDPEYIDYTLTSCAQRAGYNSISRPLHAGNLSSFTAFDHRIAKHLLKDNYDRDALLREEARYTDKLLTAIGMKHLIPDKRTLGKFTEDIFDWTEKCANEIQKLEQRHEDKLSDAPHPA